jgi:hypothetical protein
VPKAMSLVSPHHICWPLNEKNPLWQYVPWRCLRVPFKSVCVKLLLGACLCQINSFTFFVSLAGLSFLPLSRTLGCQLSWNIF